AVSNQLTFAPGVLATNINIPIVNDVVNRGQRQFAVLLANPSAGWQVASPSNALVTIVDDDPLTNNFSDVSLPSSVPRGTLQVWLTPTNAAGQWHFWWENDWRDSGSIASNLEAGDYDIEF